MRPKVNLAIGCLCLTVALLSIFVLYRLHFRIIDSGSYEGIEIGMPKDEVLSSLVSHQSTASIQPIVTQIEVSHQNLQGIKKLIWADAILVQGLDFRAIISFDGDNILWSNKYGVGSGFEGEWKTKKDLIDNLTLFLERDKHAAAISVARPPNRFEPATLLISKNASLNSDEKMWIYSFDRWLYHEDGQYVFLTFYFVDDRLEKIEYRNDFGEGP